MLPFYFTFWLLSIASRTWYRRSYYGDIGNKLKAKAIPIAKIYCKEPEFTNIQTVIHSKKINAISSTLSLMIKYSATDAEDPYSQSNNEYSMRSHKAEDGA
ncbi:hypothetical protein HZH68_016198 [Vespula germanica]|uniref:Uncharacterized protein n=1 Tax=Vespula germanica TaxID=30212 RepID=A0A834J1V4_VESGE|nr:hypothetical protein HZH68_016198 [Vespula germanica]